MKRILLITVGLSMGLFATLSKSGDVVSDGVTGLQWQDNVISVTMKWYAAINYCETLSLEGQSDWRLPNIKELTSIVDDSKISPSIDTDVFENISSNYFWSSTTYADDTSNAWRVHFYGGDQYYNTKESSYYVRCVRAGQ